MRALVVALVICGVARGAAAHPLDLGYLRVIQARGTVAVTLDLDARAAAILLGVPALDDAGARAGASALARATFAAAPITTPTGPCTWGPPTATLVARTVTIASTAVCAGPGPRSWTFPFVHDHAISTKFELLVKEVAGGVELLTLVDASRSELVLAGLGTPAPDGWGGLVAVVLAIAISAIGGFCAILRRWRRRTTSTMWSSDLDSAAVSPRAGSPRRATPSA